MREHLFLACRVYAYVRCSLVSGPPDCDARLLLSYCPGGIYEVAVIAIFFDLDPEFVSFHHIIRLLMILFIVPIILRFLKKT